MRQGALVARRLPVHALLVRIAPARVHPDLGVDPDELAIECLGQELEIGIRAVRPRGASVVRRLLDLDEGAAGGGQLTELGVHDVAEIVDQGLLVTVVLVPQHAGEGGRADGAELDGLVGETLGHLPERGVLERSSGEPALDHAGLIGLLDFPEDLAGAKAVPLHPASRRVAVALDATQTLDGIEEPRLAPHGEIEPGVAVGHDVKARGLLGIDHGGDRIEILLAKDRIAEGGLERSAAQALVEPEGARIRARDGGGQHEVLRHSQHRHLPAGIVSLFGPSRERRT